MVEPIPDRYPRVTPYLIVDGAGAAIDTSMIESCASGTPFEAPFGAPFGADVADQVTGPVNW